MNFPLPRRAFDFCSIPNRFFQKFIVALPCDVRMHTTGQNRHFLFGLKNCTIVHPVCLVPTLSMGLTAPGCSHHPGFLADFAQHWSIT